MAGERGEEAYTKIPFSVDWVRRIAVDLPPTGIVLNRFCHERLYFHVRERQAQSHEKAIGGELEWDRENKRGHTNGTLNVSIPGMTCRMTRVVSVGSVDPCTSDE